MFRLGNIYFIFFNFYLSLLISHPVAAWVKNLVVKKHNLPVTKIVDDIMEQIQGNDKDKDSIF